MCFSYLINNENMVVVYTTFQYLTLLVFFLYMKQTAKVGCDHRPSSPTALTGFHLQEQPLGNSGGIS